MSISKLTRAGLLAFCMLTLTGCSSTSFVGQKTSSPNRKPTSATVETNFNPEVEESNSTEEKPTEIATDGGDSKAGTLTACGGVQTEDGCFYGVGQHTKYPIDVGLANVQVSCNDFCATRGGSSPIGLTCDKCAPLFDKLYTGPKYSCQATPSVSNPYLTLPTARDGVAGLNAIYTSSCSVVYMHAGKQAFITSKYASIQPDYSLNFGRVFSGGAVDWSTYICRCKN